MEKLTLQDCFKYPNARIKEIGDDSVGCTYYDTIFEMIYKQGDFDSRQNTTTLKDIFEDYTLSEFKLILRPLSSLTDEEKKTLEPFFTDRQYFNTWDGTYLNMIQHCFSFKIKQLIDYLRSINIDIDGLQERGLCIYE